METFSDLYVTFGVTLYSFCSLYGDDFSHCFFYNEGNPQQLRTGYQDAAEEDIRRYESSFRKLPSSHKVLISHCPSKFEELRRCISVNTKFITNMLEAFEPPMDMSPDEGCKPDQGNMVGSNVMSNSPGGSAANNELHVPLVDIDKVRGIIRNIVRDWSAEGQIERDQCYKPILEELDRLFPNRQKESPPACLVPGAGLGRLALEISGLGFVSQGIEFSYYMIICSSFIVNQVQGAEEWTIYPWIHSNCNILSDNDQLRAILIPDVHPASAGTTKNFSMRSGDFVEVYKDPSQVGAWDAVVTCFFIDTAHNIIEYIEIISRILRDGGVWINIGPLLYHFADMYGQDELSIELSLEDVKRIAMHYGFQIERESTVETTFAANPRSMMRNHYYAAFWTMTKRQGMAKVDLVAS